MCHVNENFNREDWDRVLDSMKEERNRKEQKEIQDKIDDKKRAEDYLQLMEFARQQIDW